MELVFNQNGQSLTTSRRIAWKFGKRHSRLLQTIRETKFSTEFRGHHFVLSSYLTNQNKELPEYVITKDGFYAVVFGFTGEKAIKFKEEFIAEFNRKEQELQALRAQQSTTDVQPTSAFDALELMFTAMKENRFAIQAIQSELHEVKAKVTTRPDYFTIAGFASLHNIKVGFEDAKVLGRKAAALCKKEKIHIEKVTDVRWGRVGSYPKSILTETFTFYNLLNDDSNDK